MTRSFRWSLLPLMLIMALTLLGTAKAHDLDKNKIVMNGDNTKTVEVRDSSGACVLRGGIMIIDSDDADDHDGDFYNIKLESAMDESDKPDGKMQLAVERDNGEIDGLEMDLKVKHLSPNSSYMLFVDGSQVGTFTTDSSGSSEIDLDVGDTDEFIDMKAQ